MPTKPQGRCRCGRRATYRGKCATCAQRHEQARGTRQQRGYDQRHLTLRAWWAPRVATGQVTCARCGQVIRPGTPWHLDHSDDRAGYLGPSHEACNISAAHTKKNPRDGCDPSGGMAD